MSTKRIIFLVLSIFSFILISVTADAHDFWIEKKNERFWVMHGHEGKAEKYDPARVVEVKAFGDNGQGIAVKTYKDEEGFSFVPKGKVYVVLVTFDNKYWVKTTDGWKNIGKIEALKQSLNILEAGKSFKFSKYIEKWTNALRKPLGTKMEIIPQKNPLILKVGDTLPVKVILDGKPASDIPITTNWSHDEIAKTDKNGLVNIIINKNGLNLISAKTKIPIKNDPDADIMYLNATLVFGVK